MLSINYSTAKTILRIFRIERRIEKKNADEERELKEIIYKFRKQKYDETTKSTEEIKDSINIPLNENNFLASINPEKLEGKLN